MTHYIKNAVCIKIVAQSFEPGPLKNIKIGGHMRHVLWACMGSCPQGASTEIEA